MKRKTLGLALGAGGARGTCHIGAIEALIENGIQIDYITGSSMGAVIGGAFATGSDIYKIENRFREAKMSEIFDFNLRPISNGGFLKGRASEKLILPFLKCENFEETEIPFKCTAVDLISGKPYIFSSGKLMTGIRASMSIPGVFEPVVFEEMLLVDGGVLNRLPVGCIREFKPDVILCVDALGPLAPIKNKPNLLSAIMRSFEIADWETAGKYYEQEDEIIVCPNIGDFSQFSSKTIPFAIEAGKECVLKNLDRIKQALKIK